jgi:hypothetical protein
MPDAFRFDMTHLFKRGDSNKICKNTADILTKTRYAAHFEVSEEDIHRGLFNSSAIACD